MLSLFLLPALLVPQSAAAVTLAPDAEARWVAFDITPSNQLLFEMQLNGRAARAILDTGVSHTIVTRDFAARAGLVAKGGQQATAIGGAVRIDWANVSDLSFGGLTRRGGRVGISGALGQERFGADVFVGADLLGCCALEIDYDARRFRILPSGRLPFTGTNVPLSLARGSGVFHSGVTLGGRRLRPLIVDTGDGSSVTLSRAAWTSAGYRGATLTTTLGWGLGGPQVTEVAMVPVLSLGAAPPTETEVRIEGPDGYSASVGAAGRIGNGLLSRYHVLLDPRAGRMVIRPGARIDTPPIRSTSGLLLGYSGGALRVLHVMRGSPAAETGWREGDTICASDGAPVAERADGPGSIAWGAGAPGRVVRVTLCDGRERTLTLRRFY